MSLLSSRTLAKKLLTSKSFRKTYVWEHLKRSIPFQMRTLRDERGWSQERAAQELQKTQSMISRLESPAYGKMSLQTLIEIAEGFDVGLLIKFVPFSRLVREYEDVSFSSLSAKSVTDPKEAARLEAWSAERPSDTRPIVIAGTGTGESAILSKLFREHTAPEMLEISRKPNLPSVPRSTGDNLLTFGRPAA